MKTSTKAFFLNLFTFWCISAQAQTQDLVTPVVKNGKYTLSFGNYYFEVDPAPGGRVSSFKLDGKEILNLVPGDWSEWGSVVFPSPQSTLGWPLPEAFEKQTSAGKIDSSKIVMTTPVDSKTQFSFVKKYSGSTKDNSITIEYYLNNTTTSPKQAGIWEVTRVKSGGLVFFPKGTGLASGGLAPLLKENNGIYWMDYDSTKVKNTSNPKAFSDGTEGWIAHVSNSGLVLIKQFIDAPSSSKAPNENEIEIFANNNNVYWTLENQSSYTSIPAKGSKYWKMKWYLRQLPSNIKPTAGNPELVSFVKSIIQGSVTEVSEQSLEEKAFSIYPNPIKDKATVQFLGNTTEELRFILFDNQGKEIRDLAIIGGKAEFERQNLTKGLYYYQVMNNKGLVIGTGKIQLD